MRENGLLNFANKIYKSDIKRSKSYILITAVTMAFIFNLINISYNDIYAKSNQIYRLAPNYDYPIQLIQKELLLIVILITVFFAAICNKNFLRRRSKELGFIMTNGGSSRTVSRYLSYITGRCYLVAAVLAIFLGFLLIPFFNFIISKIIYRNISLFNFSFEAFYISLIYIFMQYLLLITLNAGFIARKEILEIIKDEKNIEVKDNRQFKFPTSIFIVLYALPIICFFKIDSYAGVEHIINYTSILAIVGVLGVIRFFLPKFIKKIKKKEFMYKGERRIYISNFSYSISNSLIYIGISRSFNLFYWKYY